MSNYYNEFDKKAAAWLRELIKRSLIPQGDVDERDIREVRGEELRGYTQCHFFAGIGGWSYALRLAGWPEDRPVWTGSCPCQPFSCAGQGKGEADERHLWPEFRRLISECGSATVLGEQVASKAGREWLAGVRTDLEGMAYAVGAADLCAAGVSAPHIRQRLYWVANTRRSSNELKCRPSETLCQTRAIEGETQQRERGGITISDGGAFSGLADSKCPERGPLVLRYERNWNDAGRYETTGGLGVCGETSGLAHADGGKSRHRELQPSGQHGQQQEDDGAMRVADSERSGLSRQPLAMLGPGNQGNENSWAHYDLIPCLDGKARRVESGTFPLADGVPARVGRLRGYGNAIVPPLAAEFIRAYMDITLNENLY